MFLRKMTVILVPLGMVILLCLLAPLLFSLPWFWGSLLWGSCTGVLLAFLLPLAGATRLREPFAWLLWIPAVVLLLVLLYQYLASVGTDIPLFRLLATSNDRIVTMESAFAAFLLAFSIRTGRGI